MAEKKLVLQVRKDVPGNDYQTGKKYLFDKIFVTVNGLELQVKGADTDAKNILKDALEKKQELHLVRGEDGVLENGRTYEQYFTVINGNEIPLKVGTRTAKNLINKILEERG